MSDEIATLALKVDSTDFESKILRCTKGTDNLGISATRTGASIAGMWASGKLVNLFKDAALGASGAREDLAQFEHVMRHVTKASREMVESLTSADFGRTERQAQQMLMNLTSMAKGMGMVDATALKFAGDISKVSIDIGSFMAKDPSDVVNAFSSSLMGFNQALRPYGIFITEAILKNKMLAQAKEGLVFASEREARAFAILSEATRQQADAIGDYAIEAYSLSNQLKQVGPKAEQAMAKFGKGLLEPATQGVIALNKLLDMIAATDDETMKLISRSAVLGTALAATGSVILGINEYLKVRNAILATGAAATATDTAAKKNDSVVTSALAKTENVLAASTAASTKAIQAETVALAKNVAAKKSASAVSLAGQASPAAQKAVAASAAFVPKTSLKTSDLSESIQAKYKGGSEKLSVKIQDTDQRIVSLTEQRRKFEHEATNMQRLLAVQKARLLKEDQVALARIKQAAIGGDVSAQAKAVRDRRTIARQLAKAEAAGAATQTQLQASILASNREIDALTRKRASLQRARLAAESRMSLAANAGKMSVSGSGFNAFSRRADDLVAVRQSRVDEKLAMVRRIGAARAEKDPVALAMREIASPARVPIAINPAKSFITGASSWGKVSDAAMVAANTSTITKAMPNLGPGITKMFSGVSNFLPATLGKLSTGLTSVGKLFAGLIGPIGGIAAIGATIYGGLKLLAKAPEMLAWLKDPETWEKTLYPIGKSIVQGITDAITYAWNGAVQLIGDAMLGSWNLVLGMFGETDADRQYKLDKEVNKRRKAEQEAIEDKEKQDRLLGEETMRVSEMRKDSDAAVDDYWGTRKTLRRQDYYDRATPEQKLLMLDEDSSGQKAVIDQFEDRRNAMVLARDKAIVESQQVLRDENYNLDSDAYKAASEKVNVLNGQIIQQSEEAKNALEEYYKINKDRASLEKSIEDENKRGIEELQKQIKESQKYIEDIASFRQGLELKTIKTDAGKSDYLQKSIQEVFDSLDIETDLEKRKEKLEKALNIQEQIQSLEERQVPLQERVTVSATSSVDRASVQARELESRVFGRIAKEELVESKKSNEYLEKILEEVSKTEFQANQNAVQLEGVTPTF